MLKHKELIEEHVAEAEVSNDVDKLERENYPEEKLDSQKYLPMSHS